MSADGKTLYIGGDFTWVGTPSGSFVPVDGDTGATAPHLNVNGSVSTQVADGAGGWYIVGTFTTVGGVSRSNIAHLKADGSLDANFGGIANLSVSALALNGADLYLSGCFVGGANNSQCVVEDVDAATGASAKWTVAGAANLLAVSGNSLYMGGGFQAVAGVNRFKLAALDTRTGALLPWNPNPGFGAGVPMIDKIVATGNTVYVGGQFTTIGGAAHTAVAALDAATGLAQAWDAGLSGYDGMLFVRAIVLDGSTLYIGGSFATAGGQSRVGVAALDAATASALPWNAGLAIPGAEVFVNALAVNASRVFIGGQFALPGSSATVRSAALDKVSATQLPWLDAGGQNVAITQLDVVGSQVFVGGSFALLSGTRRNHIAAVDLATGQLTNWDPDSVNTDGDSSTGVVTQLLVSGSTVYAGGTITHIGGADRHSLAALDAATGAARPWDPQVVGYVTSLAASSTTLFVGGSDVTSAGGQTRAGLAAFDLASGQLTSWAPTATGATIVRLVATDSTVFLGGAFSTISGQARNGLAAFDANSGALLTWNPDAATEIPGSGFNVMDMALSAGTLYFVGDFDMVGGQPRLGIAAVDAVTGAVQPFGATQGTLNPRAVAVSGDRVYVALNEGGGTPPAQAVLALSIAQNAILPTSYILEGWVGSILPVNGRLYFAGQFTDSAGGVSPNLANYLQ